MGTRSRRAGIGAVMLCPVLLLSSCSRAPVTTVSLLTGHTVTHRCLEAPPNAGCASEVAHQLGFPVAWLPVPQGWSAGGAADSQGVADFPGFLGRFGVPEAVATERLHRAGVIVVLVSGGVGEDPTVSRHVRLRWRGLLVREASGVPTPRPNQAAWMVADTWRRGGHAYRLYVEGIPAQGTAGTVAAGRLVARGILADLEYTSPGS